jgi:hypothetical protein
MRSSHRRWDVVHGCDDRSFVAARSTRSSYGTSASPSAAWRMKPMMLAAMSAFVFSRQAVRRNASV